MNCDKGKKKDWFWQKAYQIGVKVIHRKCFGEIWLNGDKVSQGEKNEKLR